MTAMAALRAFTKPIYERLHQMVQIGRLALVDDSAATQRMQVETSFSDTKTNVARYEEYGRSSNPPAGSRVVMLGVGGLRANSLVLAVAAAADRPLSLNPGEICDYTDEGVIIIHKRTRKTEIHCDTLTIFADTKVRIETPRLEVTGDIIDQCDGTGETMADQRSVFNGHVHAVTGVAAGAASVVTSAPESTE